MECRIHIPQSLPINKSLTIFSVNSGYTLFYCLRVARCGRERGWRPQPGQAGERGWWAPQRVANPLQPPPTRGAAASGAGTAPAPMWPLGAPGAFAPPGPWDPAEPPRGRSSANPRWSRGSSCCKGPPSGSSNFHFMNK